MTPDLERRGLRALLYVGGAVATAAGLHSAIAGARSLPGEDHANPVVESELRYYAGFYVAYGVAALRVAPRADHDAAAVRGLASALFAAGLARGTAWIAAGKPHPLQRALLAAELTLPAVMVGWQARLEASKVTDVPARSHLHE